MVWNGGECVLDPRKVVVEMSDGLAGDGDCGSKVGC